jgi:hypothetical protein
MFHSCRRSAVTGAWDPFFEAVLDYCASVIEGAGGDERRRRLSFWGTLALMRCVASSPAAAAQALRTRASLGPRGGQPAGASRRRGPLRPVVESHPPLQRGGKVKQRLLDFGDLQESRAIDSAWKDAAEKAKRNRTVFAQRRLKPQDVLPEWKKTLAVLGGQDDVKRFTDRALARLTVHARRSAEPISITGSGINCQSRH